MYSTTSELYARILQFPITNDVENSILRRTTAQGAVDFLAQWVEKDIDAVLRGKAAWKLVMEAGCRVEFLVRTDIDIVRP
jgi:hypothetical protein